MKKVLLAVLVALGLQTQAQITCDSITTTYLDITPAYIEVTTNVMSFGIPYTDHTWDLYEGCQFAQLTIVDTNVTAIIPLPNPMVNDTFVLCSWDDFFQAPWSCYPCDTFTWDYNYGIWSMMQQQTQTQIQINCDSITYWTDQSQGFNIGLDTTGIVHNLDSIEVWWQVCTNGLCYSGDGMYDYFPQVTTSDTLKVSYDVYIYENGVMVEVCQREDWLVFDQNSFSWVLLNTIPTSINEITSNSINDNRIYDMLGREVNDVVLGTMYIRNGKKYIQIK